jgi:hypothetical protein
MQRLAQNLTKLSKLLIQLLYNGSLSYDYHGMKNHLVGFIVLIFSVNKHAPAGFLVESIEQYRRDTLKDELSQWPE